MALGGDGVALRLCLERLLSTRKEGPVAIKLPEMSNATDATRALSALFAGVASGELTPSEGNAIGALVNLFIRVQEAEALGERLTAVEQELQGRI